MDAFESGIVGLVKDKDATVYLYCRSGNRSGKALKIMQKLGYTNAANVGGINEGSANASGIFVLRGSDAADKLVDVYQLNAEVGSMLILSTQFQLEPMDVVYVTSAPVARWNRVVSQLLPSITTLYQLDRISKE